MHVLVINCGSSSVKCDVLDPADGGRAGVSGARGNGRVVFILPMDALSPTDADHDSVLKTLIPALTNDYQIDAVGHRVVHGGPDFNGPIAIDDNLVEAIEELSNLAPLHNPPNLAGIRAARNCLPNVPHVAVFDTAFHATMPRRAKAYALPKELTERYDIRRYGFHGPSHQWVAQQAANWMDEDIGRLRIITCHLGNGASVCAVEYGRSVETSMGMTPLEGLVMGTRSGDVDPGLLLDVMRKENLDADALDDLLNRQSGLAGVSGVGNDMRDIEERAARGDEACRLAIQVFAHRLRKYIGAYATLMGGVDAIVFTAGIGENSALVRHRVAQRLGFLGAHLDEDKNREAQVSSDTRCVHMRRYSRAKILVVKTDEARAIAQATVQIAQGEDGSMKRPFP